MSVTMARLLDVHLMIQNPDSYLSEFRKAGADVLTVHYEACTHLHRTIQAIKELGMKAGVALNPHTPVSAIKHIASDLDLVLIMSVNPGFGGQQFILNAVDKVRELNEFKSALDEVIIGDNKEPINFEFSFSVLL